MEIPKWLEGFGESWTIKQEDKENKEMADSFKATDYDSEWRALRVKDTGELVCRYQRMDISGIEYYALWESKYADQRGEEVSYHSSVGDIRKVAQGYYDRIHAEGSEQGSQDFDLGSRERETEAKWEGGFTTGRKATKDLEVGDKIKAEDWNMGWVDFKDEDGFITITTAGSEGGDDWEFEGGDNSFYAATEEVTVKIENEQQGAEGGEFDDSLKGILKNLADKLGVELEESSEGLEAQVEALKKQVEEFSTEGLPPIHIQIPEATEVEVLPPGTYHKMLPDVLTALAEGEHVMLAGPAGSGKSTIAKQAWEALGSPGHWASISCNPTMTETVLKGFVDAHGNFRKPPQHPTYTEGGVWLVDEIDGGSPGLLTGMNQMLSNDTYAFADGMAERHADFVVCATANTFGRGADRTYVGRNALDAATLDRFTVLHIGYDEALETNLCLAIGKARDVAETDVKDWLTKVREWRTLAETARLNAVISPRTSMSGVKYLAHGWDFDKIAHAKFAGGLSGEQLDKLGIKRVEV